MLLALLLQAAAAPAPIDTVLARRYFAEAAQLAARDAGRLWGRPVGGTLLFTEPRSRALLAEVPDGEGRLAAQGGFHAGTLPGTETIANHATTWAGRQWIMLAWPLPADSLERSVILVHEQWHGIQDSLGFPAASPPNSHLGSRNGRLWLRLEARALRRAFAVQGAARISALRDAIAFRRARRAGAPGAEVSERGLEMNEGLAEYTGVVLATSDDSSRRALVLKRLIALDSTEHYERGFAYQTGPAWGYFLDELAAGWRTGLTPGDDLAYRLEAAIGKGATGRSAALRGAAYGYASVRKAEDARAARLRVHLAAQRKRFETGPLLVLPMAAANFGFDPWKAEALDSVGTVYGMLRVSASWGVLQCDASGGLIASDWTRIIIPAPADTSGRRLTGPGWVLELTPAWRLAPGRRRGDWTVEPIP